MVTGRPRYYHYEADDIAFIVLDTTENSQNITGGQLEFLTNAINGLAENITHLVLISHHLVWLADYPPLAHLFGSGRIGGSSNRLAGLNFQSEVYPLLLQAKDAGVEVFCLAGDRTGINSTEFFIDHTTAEGVHFIAAGCQEEMLASLRNVVVLERDVEAGTLTYSFVHLSDLPRIPDETLMISEVHYDPGVAQGDEWAFVELYNWGSEPYDLSGAAFSSGVTYTFPPDTIVAPGEYLVVALDAARYADIGARVFQYAGGTLPTPLNRIWLRDSRHLEIDYLKLEESGPWPPTPNNQGPSLMLIDPRFDNTLATNWAASDQVGGTPGRANLVPPVLNSLVIDESGVTLEWQGLIPGRHYRLEFSPTLEPADWQPILPSFQATEDSMLFSDAGAIGFDQRFYRLGRLFP
jgi:hypothetical protein